MKLYKEREGSEGKPFSGKSTAEQPVQHFSISFFNSVNTEQLRLKERALAKLELEQ